MADFSHVLTVQKEAAHVASAMDEVLADVERTLAVVFETTAHKYPHQKAVGSGRWQPTYRELNEAADYMAFIMHQNGALPGDRAAVLMSHDTPILVVLLGLLKAGTIFVVINPANPPARIQQIIADTGARWLITDQAHQALATRVSPASPGCHVIGYEKDIRDSSAKVHQIPFAMTDMKPGDAVMLIYTSGSTGRPKGVIQNHRNILHSVRSYTMRLGYRSKDRFCLLSTLDGGQGIMTMFCALLNGATLYPYALRKRGTVPLVSWMIKHKISVLTTAASIFRRLIAAAGKGCTFPHLRLVRLGAEAATTADLEQCRKIASPKCLFAHVMASSETLSMTQFVGRVSDLLDLASLPVGIPDTGKTLLLLDDNGKEVVDGEEGQFVVRSSYLSPGYWNDADTTREAFKTLPESAERLYFTGDIGRRLPDGNLEHLGRKDRICKILGNRVHLHEIEAAICQIPQISQAIAAMVPTPHKTMTLTAWFVSRAPMDSSELRDKLGQLLPMPMIPARLISVDAIPHAANGKPELKILTEISLQDSERTDEIRPRTAAEKHIAGIWCQVLGRPTIGIYQTFFDAGGDSLQAVDLVMQLSQELGVEFTSGHLLGYPTIAQQAEAFEDRNLHGSDSREQEPWIRKIRVSLLPISKHKHSRKDRRPLLFIPGGACTEDELLIFAQMFRKVGEDRAAFGARLNLKSKRVWQPWSIRQLAAKIGRKWCKVIGNTSPVIIGECVACPLALETALWLGKRQRTVPELLLLDPWHPQGIPQPSTSPEVMPAAIIRYHKLLKASQIRPYPHPVHLICSSESGRSGHCQEWWSQQTGNVCSIREAPGDHTTYLRDHGATLAQVIDEVITTLEI